MTAKGGHGRLFNTQPAPKDFHPGHIISTRKNPRSPLAFVTIRSTIHLNGRAIFQKERADQRQSWRVGNGTHFWETKEGQFEGNLLQLVWSRKRDGKWASLASTERNR